MVAQSSQLLSTWNVTPNLHNTPFVTLLDSASYFIFNNFADCIAHGWTTKFTCDGITGPANSADTTNRLLSKANCITQGAAAGSPQTWFVITNADGVQLGMFFQGATNDIIRIAYSPGGLYTLAGTTTNQPTATDEVVVSNGNSIIGATASADRVLHIWNSSGGRNWSCAVFRSSALVNIIGVEKVNDITSTGVFSVPYVGYRLNNGARSNQIGSPYGGNSGTAVGSAGHLGIMARIFTSSAFRITRMGGGEILCAPVAGNTTTQSQLFQATPPATTAPGGGSPFMPLLWSGEAAAFLDGFIAYPIDWWVMYTSSLTVPALGNFSPGYDPGDVPGVSPASPRTNWYVAIGAAMIRPWRNAAAAMDIA